MKGITVFSVLLAATMSCRVIGQTNERVPPRQITAPQQGGHNEEGLLQLLRKRRDAYYHRDIARFSRLEASEFTRITESGKLVTKEEQLANMKAQMASARPSEPIPIYADHDLNVHTYGDVAVITGRLTERGESTSGKDYNDQSRFTEIWVRRKGAWQTVHNHYTNITKQRLHFE
jgi:ketosteroid isomerase-like protein